ncbi:MAG: tetratricopeptide repeat protein [Longimicrobiales bacterium]
MKRIARWLSGSLGLLLLAPALAGAQTMAQADTLFQAGKWDDAQRVYLGVLRADSTNAVAWYRLARVALEGRSEPQRAITYYQASLLHGFVPNVIPHLGMARAYMALKDHNRALAQLDTIAAYGFAQPEAVRADSIFKPLAGHSRFESVLTRFQRNTEPCQHIPEARQFDFWVGDWAVSAPNGQRLGNNRIEKSLRGCALIENWTDGSSREGKSISTFDPVLKTWHQLWVSDNGTVTDYAEGSVEGSSLHFLARWRNANGDSVRQRMVFHAVHADTVRQVIDSSTDRGRTWSPPWVGIYTRQPSARSEVLAAVAGFLKSSLAKDTAGLSQYLHANARLTLMRPGPNGPRVLVFSASDFAKLVANPNQPGLDEAIRNSVVYIDADLAHVWAEYQVRRAGAVSQCGYDSFQLVRSDGGWKILNVSDTFRTTGCGQPWPR